mmetsp:Transcript_8171/g.25981  ORF Transcript_8171/g.25981 Transcript_8171/m.25981 type:complete len:221 (-) Transcript_8171:389-1051(-)
MPSGEVLHLTTTSFPISFMKGSVKAHCPLSLHSFKVRSAEVVPMQQLEGLTVTPRTPAWWPLNTAKHSPSGTLHNLAVLSVEPVTILLPSKYRSTHNTAAVCPHSTLRHSPESALQIIPVPSDETVKTQVLANRNTTSTVDPSDTPDSASVLRSSNAFFPTTAWTRSFALPSASASVSSSSLPSGLSLFSLMSMVSPLSSAASSLPLPLSSTASSASSCA